MVDAAVAVIIAALALTMAVAVQAFDALAVHVRRRVRSASRPALQGDRRKPDRSGILVALRLLLSTMIEPGQPR
jgi:hypothetical protein